MNLCERKNMKKVLLSGIFCVAMYMPGISTAELVDPNADNLIFGYDNTPGQIIGEDAAKRNKIGEIDVFDYSESTFSFWMKIDGYTDNWTSIFHVGNTNLQRYPGVFVHKDSSTLYYRVATVDTAEGNLDPAPALDLGEWYQITSVFSGGRGTVYFNGVEVKETAIPIDWTMVEDETWSIYAADPWHVAGDMEFDSVRIYDTALSEQEVGNLKFLDSYVDVPVPYMISALGLFFAVRNRRKR